MAKGNAFANDLMKHLFQNEAIANLGDATGIRGSSTPGQLFVALHTADPTAAGDQTSHEISYTGYARVGVARSSAGWTVSTNTATNAAAITFGKCTAGSATATHASIGVATSGASETLYSAALASSLAISANVIPNLAIGALSVSES